MGQQVALATSSNFGLGLANRSLVLLNKESTAQAHSQVLSPLMAIWSKVAFELETQLSQSIRKYIRSFEYMKSNFRQSTATQITTLNEIFQY